VGVCRFWAVSEVCVSEFMWPASQGAEASGRRSAGGSRAGGPDSDARADLNPGERTRAGKRDLPVHYTYNCCTS